MTVADNNKAHKLENTNIECFEHLSSPSELKSEFPSGEGARAVVYEARETIHRILDGRDRRLIGVVGPCSIHDRDVALEYARRFRVLKDKVQESMFLVMRVYFEKPRTNVGWRGLLIDPHMDNSNRISEGLRLGRQILIDINSLGVPAGSEYLDPVVPSYVDDLVCWASIGARTIESQTHRDMASGVSVPVGFKNSTDGEIINAVNAMILSSTPRGFIGINGDGDTSIVHTKGNKFTHLILRGGKAGPNYFPSHVSEAASFMTNAGLKPRIMIDCSHGNSLKNYKNQRRVFRHVIEQCITGEDRIIGFMLESNLQEGRQDIPTDSSQLEYGKSITDACMSMEETEECILEMHQFIKKNSVTNQYGV